MAISSSNSFNKAAGSPPAVVGQFDKFEQHASPKFSVGYKVEEADGSVYRYCHFGADVAVGVLVSTDVSETCIAESDNNITAPTDCVDTTDGTLGSKYVQMTATGTSGQFRGAKFVTTDDTGEGYTYDIVGNTATNDPATSDLRIQLAQPLQVAVDGSTNFIIQSSLYNDCEIVTTGTDQCVAGVTCAAMDVSSAAWGWVQTKGVVGILTDTTPAKIGEITVVSANVDGAVMAMGATAHATLTSIISDEILGVCLQVGDSTGYGVYKINIS